MQAQMMQTRRKSPPTSVSPTRAQSTPASDGGRVATRNSTSPSAPGVTGVTSSAQGTAVSAESTQSKRQVRLDTLFK